jgi:hypothetical protein
MFRKTISLALCIAMFLYIYGCTSTRTVSVEEFQKEPNKGIEKVILTDGSVVEFDVLNGKMGIIKDGEIIGFSKNGGELRHIPTRDVQAIYYTDSDTGKTVLLGVGILALGVVIAAASMAASLNSAFNHIGR